MHWPKSHETVKKMEKFKQALEATQVLVIQSAGPFMNNTVTQACNRSIKIQPIGSSPLVFQSEIPVPRFGFQDLDFGEGK